MAREWVAGWLMVEKMLLFRLRKAMAARNPEGKTPMRAEATGIQKTPRYKRLDRKADEPMLSPTQNQPELGLPPVPPEMPDLPPAIAGAENMPIDPTMMGGGMAAPTMAAPGMDGAGMQPEPDAFDMYQQNSTRGF